MLFSFIPCTMFNLPPHFCHFFQGLSYSFESPFRRAYFNLEGSFVFLPISVIQRIVSESHQFGGCKSVSALPFHVFQKFFGRRLLLLLALCPFLLFFLSIPQFFRFRSCKTEIPLDQSYPMTSMARTRCCAHTPHHQRKSHLSSKS